MGIDAFVNVAKKAACRTKSCFTVDKAATAAVKQIAIFAIVLMAFFPFGACAASTGKAGDAEKKIVLAFGDSLTAGYGLDRSDALPVYLQRALEGAGQGNVDIVNAGVSGDTTAGGVTRLAWTLKRQNPDYVILALGGNDMLRAIDPATTEQNLRKMMETLKAANIPVLLAGMRAPASMGEKFAGAYDKMYANLAKEYDAVYYPFILDGVAMLPEYNQRDGVHPNTAGVKIIAQKMLPYVQQLLAK